jgi:hypothetical protein
MPLRYEGNTVHFEDHCIVDEALDLVQFFNNTQAARVDMSRCASAHTALVQILPVAGVDALIAPSDPSLAKILLPFLIEFQVNVVQPADGQAAEPVT